MLLLLISAATIESVHTGIEVDVLKMEAYRYYRCKGQGVSAIGLNTCYICICSA